jgi:hypothetical protein
MMMQHDTRHRKRHTISFSPKVSSVSVSLHFPCTNQRIMPIKAMGSNPMAPIVPNTQIRIGFQSYCDSHSPTAPERLNHDSTPRAMGQVWHMQLRRRPAGVGFWGFIRDHTPFVAKPKLFPGPTVSFFCPVLVGPTIHLPRRAPQKVR